MMRGIFQAVEAQLGIDAQLGLHPLGSLGISIHIAHHLDIGNIGDNVFRPTETPMSQPDLDCLDHVDNSSGCKVRNGPKAARSDQIFSARS